MERGWFPQVLPHSRQRSSYRVISYSLLQSSWGRAWKRVPKNGKLFSGSKEKRLRNANTLHPESHVPRFRVESWHLRSRYMIPTRLPWRRRARPSATLHEIQVCSEERTCRANATGPRRVYQPGCLSDIRSVLYFQFSIAKCQFEFRGRLQNRKLEIDNWKFQSPAVLILLLLRMSLQPELNEFFNQLRIRQS